MSTKTAIFYSTNANSFVCLLNQVHCIYQITPTQSNVFGLCLQVFYQAGPLQRTAWPQLKINAEVSFPKTQQRIASSIVELPTSILSITNSTELRRS